MNAARLKEMTQRVELIEGTIREVKALSRKLDKIDVWGGSVLGDIARELETSIAKERGLIANWKLYNASRTRRR